MSNETQIYLATVFYTDKANARQSIKALVLGAAPDDAIREALTIARSLPDCEEVLCGMLEPADADLLAAVLPAIAATIAAEEDATHQPAPRAYRAPGTTVH